MTRKLDRRDFFKAAAGAGATLGLSPRARRFLSEPFVQPPEEALPGRATWYATTCGECPAGCGVIVREINGRPRKIEGNPQHPLNRGKVCARGQAALQRLYNPDRLRSPIRRVGRRDSRDFRAMHWDEALDQIASAIEGPGSEGRVAFLAGMVIPNHLHVLASQLLNALGSEPPVVFDLHTMVEGRQDLHAASLRWLGGSELPIFDIGRTEVVFSFGANFLETWLSPVAQAVDYGLMRQGPFGGRGHLVQFEPRMSSTAAVADEWIACRPGTEGLIALALGRIIVEEGLGTVGSHRDHAYLYRDVNVGEISSITGISAESLSRLARVFADVERSVAIPGGSLSGHSNRGESFDSVMALNFIMRRVGRVGGVFLPTRVPSEVLDHPVTPSSYADMLRLIEQMRWDRLDVLFIHSSNPVYDLPSWTGFASVLARVPLVVSFSSTVDDTAAVADLILPDHTPLERWSYRLPSPAADRPTVSGSQPTVKPLYNTRSTGDVLIQLAQRLGGPAAETLPWPDEASFLSQASSELLGSSIGRYDARTEAGFWSRWRQFGGWWSERSILREPAPVEPPSGGLQVTAPSFLGESSRYPLHLLIYPSVTLGAGEGAQMPLLQEVADPMTTARWGSWIEINPQTASQLGIAEHDLVRVASPEAELELPAVLYPGIRPEVVAIPLGRGQSDGGRFAAGRGVNPVRLLTPAPSDRWDEFPWASTRVRVEPTGRKAHLARLESLEGEGRESLR